MRTIDPVIGRRLRLRRRKPRLSALAWSGNHGTTRRAAAPRVRPVTVGGGRRQRDRRRTRIHWPWRPCRQWSAIRCNVGRVTVNNRIAAIGSVCSPDHGWYEFGVPPDELQIAEIRKTPAPSPALSTGFPVEDVDFALKRPQRSSLI
jgi:hypothetical protein